MKTKLLTILLLAGSSLFAGPRVSVGIGVGVGPGYGYYAAPPPGMAYMPPCPGPGYSWVAGYWYPVGPRYYWRSGYWTRPPYAGARWIAPSYRGQRYYRGYWRR